ncbi:DUF1048 domain-containing protein [Haloglycomyces albus]|uniref:DUF1048 domain-containing protein n=1 Tax=Haloglycomyces albus TaxID=526067 RepID=UPI0004A3B507|nr:DUF1048 domain-containing protein [Haloglycomyces albus]
MAAKWIEQKKRYRKYKARIKELPENYRSSIEALERYLLIFGPGQGDSVVVMLEDLAGLFEESAADQLPLREIVGDDPVEFTETFLQNYPEGQWIKRERDRLITTIDRAAGDRS